MDRIDIHIQVPRLKTDDLMDKAPGEPSSAIRDRVMKARELQSQRLGGARINAKMSPKEIREMISLSPESDKFMRQVSAKLNISGRVFDRILRVGRTIADLAQCPEVQKNHLAEAVQYRDVSIS
jgi:magnesium chelatase family protein